MAVVDPGAAQRAGLLRRACRGDVGAGESQVQYGGTVGTSYKRGISFGSEDGPREARRSDVGGG